MYHIGRKRRAHVPTFARLSVHPPGTTVDPALKINVCVSSSSATKDRYINATVIVRMMKSAKTTMDPRVPNDDPRYTVSAFSLFFSHSPNFLLNTNFSLIPYPKHVITRATKTSKIHATVKTEKPVQKIADKSVDNALMSVTVIIIIATVFVVGVLFSLCEHSFNI